MIKSEKSDRKIYIGFLKVKCCEEMLYSRLVSLEIYTGYTKIISTPHKTRVLSIQIINILFIFIYVYLLRYLFTNGLYQY